MSINAAALSPALVEAAGSTDVPGIAGWTAIGAVIATWLLTGVPTPTLGTPLVAVGPVVEGEGQIVYADGGASLALPLAAASGSADPAGLAAWAAVGLALGAWMNSNAVIDPSTLVAVPGVNPAPLSGVGAVAFAGSDLGEKLAEAAGSTDDAGVERWTAVGDAIIDHMSSAAVVNVGTMQSPGPGGPVTGVGTLA